MLWFVCFIIPQVLIDCPILKRLVLISCVSSVSDLTHKCKQFIGTTCNTINVLTWIFFFNLLSYLLRTILTQQVFGTLQKLLCRLPQRKIILSKKTLSRNVGYPTPFIGKLTNIFAKKRVTKG